MKAQSGSRGIVILSLTSTLGKGWWSLQLLVVIATPQQLCPQERPRTHCVGGWVGCRVGLDGCGKPTEWE